MQRLFAAALLCLVSAGAEAKQSPYPPPDQFSGDHYAGRLAQGASARDVTRSVQTQRRVKRHRYRYRKPAPGYVVSQPPMRQIALVEGMTREAGYALHGRPRGCPRLFCGCGASLRLFGRIIPSLNLAANWLRFPRAAPAPGMAAAKRGHVFVLEQHIAGNMWIVHDSNSGHGRTRIHPRSIAGYTIVNPHGSV